MKEVSPPAATEEGLKQRPGFISSCQHRSHLAVKVTNLLKTDLINSSNSGNPMSCLRSAALVFLPRHLGFTDDVTSILNVMLLAAIILDFDSAPCGEAGIHTVAGGKQGFLEEEMLPAAHRASLL